MTYLGHVSNGQIFLDEPTQLPEGASVTVEVLNLPTYTPKPRQPRVRQFKPIEMPGGSLADELIRDRR